jgi:hypothetical protein
VEVNGKLLGPSREFIKLPLIPTSLIVPNPQSALRTIQLEEPGGGGGGGVGVGVGGGGGGVGEGGGVGPPQGLDTIGIANTVEHGASEVTVIVVAVSSALTINPPSNCNLVTPVARFPNTLSLIVKGPASVPIEFICTVTATVGMF